MAGANALLLLPHRLRLIALAAARRILPASLRTLLNRYLADPEEQPRRYLAAHLTIDEFFQTLNQRGVRYVVLRWFENLPDVQPHEDIDLLVADESLPLLAGLFSTNPARQALDIYSAHGQPGSNYLGIPYYPPDFATEILDSRVLHKNLYAVPNREMHFRSLAYHVVLHKGCFSTEHDYIAALRTLASEDTPAISEDFEPLYRYLEEHRCLPGIDTQRKLAARSPWLRQRLSSLPHKRNQGELMVFVVREWARHKDRMAIILHRLESVPLDVLFHWELSPQQAEKAHTALRGGNWQRGPYQTSGGRPAAFLVCYDYEPEPPSQASLAKSPFLQNAHYLVKERIRNELNRQTLRPFQANGLHSADDEEESYQYLQAIFPERVQTVLARVEAAQAYYQTPYAVIRPLDTHRTRARVEKIDFHGTPAVKKTFKPGRERFLAREVFVHETLAPACDVIPPLLAKGDNYFVIPWYENTLLAMSAREQHQTLQNAAIDIVATLAFFYNKGFALIDCHPGNVLCSTDSGIKLVDFEFLYEYPNGQRPNSFRESYDIKGVPADFIGDLPSGHRGRGRTYFNTWQPILGPLHNFSLKVATQW